MEYENLNTFKKYLRKIYNIVNFFFNITESKDKSYTAIKCLVGVVIGLILTGASMGNPFIFAIGLCLVLTNFCRICICSKKYIDKKSNTKPQNDIHIKSSEIRLLEQDGKHKNPEVNSSTINNKKNDDGNELRRFIKK